ncbi:MAG TPA: amino acid ABC transporter substrate-binding protein [Fusibacter sp.]|nr:amino acid ABC transporter substrate-binding protein [Fusibacter sp.]
MNKKIILGMVVIAVLVLVGFNLLSNKNSGEQALSSLEVIKENGVIRIGTEGTYAPFTFYNDKNELTGFDVEIAREVAKRIGVEAEFIETKWDGMFAGLDSKRFDFVANQVTIKADRIEKYDFSTPYIKTRAVLVVHENNDEIKTFEDLKGKKSGQSLTSNLAELATSYGAEIVQIDGFNQAIDLLLSERIDATINDRLSFLDFKVARPDAAIKVVAEEATSSEAAFLFNKGNEELVAAVNKALEDMKSDGTYLEISERWFGDDVSK